MTTVRFPCLECGEPFEERAELEEHWAVEEHSPAAISALAMARARGDAPHAEIEDSRGEFAPRHARTQRRRMRVIQGGAR